MRIETQRLTIFPLSYNQVLLYIDSDFALEKSLGIQQVGREVSPEFKDVIETIILPLVKENPEEYYFYTIWVLVDIEKQIITGSFDFKGRPDDLGQVEIGYGTEPIFFNQGYMTEAVAGVIEWAKDQPHIRTIIAETLNSNFASQKVLKKNHFILVDSQSQFIQWKINLKEK